MGYNFFYFFKTKLSEWLSLCQCCTQKYWAFFCFLGMVWQNGRVLWVLFPRGGRVYIIFFFISFVFCFWTQIWFLICWFNETFQLIGQKYLWIDNHTCIYYTAMKLIDEFGNYKGVYIEGWKSQLSTTCPCSKEQYYFFYLYIVYIKSTYRRLVLRQMYNVYKTQSELLNKKCQCTFIYST